MERRVCALSIILVSALLLSSSFGHEHENDGEGSPPANASSSVPCSLQLDSATKLSFNASSLSCVSLWSSQSFTLMYTQSGPSLWSFVLSAPDNNAYIALGFSPSGGMIGASTVAGWVTLSGAGTAKQYYLGGYGSANCPPDKGSLILVPESLSIVSQSSKLYLIFQLNTIMPESKLVLAVGPSGNLPGSDNYLPQHRTMTSVSVNYATGQGSSSGSPPETVPSTPASPSPSSSCSTNLNLNSSIIPFDTSSLKCYTAWRSQEFTLLYKQSGTNLWSFVLTAPDKNGYIAIGFSPNGNMRGADAVAGWVSSSGEGVVKRYSLRGYSSGECPPDQGNLVLVDGSSVIVSQSSRLYLAFQLNTSQPLSNLIYALGPSGLLPSSDFLLPTHQDKTSTYLNYASGVSTSSGGKTSAAKRLHGITAIVGWGILVLIGIAIARFGKRWDPFWYYAHISLQSSGFILGIICVIAGFSLEDDVGVDVDLHKSLGILILVLGSLQVSALLVRPGKESKLRRYWNWFHHYGGRIAIAFAIGNIFYGLKLASEAAAWSAAYGGFLGVFVAVYLVLEARAFFGKRKRESSLTSA